uniref:Si:dkey-49n23.1 n=1 Tax=Latimeria chalumnae TaxID=7897 RepID=H3B8Q9_LATCH
MRLASVCHMFCLQTVQMEHKNGYFFFNLLIQFLYLDLLKSSSSHMFLESGGSSDYQAILLDEDTGRLLLGAKNHIFLLHLDNLNRNPQKIYWPAAKEEVEHCKLAGKNAETECANFVRVLQFFNKTHALACGTGAFHPLCALLEVGTQTEETVFRLIPQSIESGRGKCPFSPHDQFTAVLTGGELYSGTSIDFMGTNAAIFRTPVQKRDQHYIRTEQNQDHWLNDPLFVGAYSIPDTYNPDDDKVYFFFKETAVESGQWDKRIFSRVARVCKNDIGGKRSLIHRWTTFLKARLICSVPGPSGMDTYFDEVEDTFLLQTKDEQNPLIFGIFTTSSAVFRGSAVCVYSMASIRAAFSGPFAHKEGLDYRWVEYKGRIPYPRPGTCPSETYDPLHLSTKDYPDDVISFMRTHQLMWDSVYPVKREPILIRMDSRFRIRRIVVDRVEADDGHYDVLFLGTDEGKVLKVISIPKENREMEAITLEEISIFQKPSAILSMKLSVKQQQLYVGSEDGAAQVSLHRCEFYGKACAECCLARDPYCAWDGTSCSRYFPTNKRRSRRQDVRHGDPLSQCWDIESALDVTEEKVMFGVELNATFLECTPKSQQTAVRWFLQRPKSDSTEQLTAGDRFVYLEQGLLIRQLQKNDTGTYHCQALEHAFSHTIARYALQVLQCQQIEGCLGRACPEEGGEGCQSPSPLTNIRLLHKDYVQLLNKAGTNPAEYCEQLWHREKRRQKVRGAKWRHGLESRKLRNRR